MTVVALIRRLRDEFTAMPGLRLREEQVQRLCGVSVSASASALRALASAGFLRALDDGSYRRADMAIDVDTRGTSGAVESPWRRILCLVEFDDESHQSLTAASQSALTYATTLGVTHRARVTALHLVPSLPDSTAEQHALVERLAEDVRRHTLGQRIPGLIDVHVASGASNGLLRSAREIRADLIVLGRQDGGAACLSQLREMLRDAPCHVLVVHPSGQAAVA
jgi:nucleotide-binding universal stress UspA family protein